MPRGGSAPIGAHSTRPDRAAADARPALPALIEQGVRRDDGRARTPAASAMMPREMLWRTSWIRSVESPWACHQRGSSVRSGRRTARDSPGPRRRPRPGGSAPPRGIAARPSRGPARAAAGRDPLTTHARRILRREDVTVMSRLLGEAQRTDDTGTCAVQPASGGTRRRPSSSAKRTIPASTNARIQPERPSSARAPPGSRPGR